MTPAVCYLDMDGVLVDFVKGALAAHDRTLPPAEVLWDFPSQIGFKGNEASFWAPLGHAFWYNLDWTGEGVELLDGLEDLFGDRVVLMTSPCATPGAVEGKVDWIRRRLPRYSRQFFVGPAKHLAAGPGKILVDDHDGNVTEFRACGGAAVLVPRPWNSLREATDVRGSFPVRLVLNAARDLLEK